MSAGNKNKLQNYYQVEDGVLKSYMGREETAVVPEDVHTIGEGAFKGYVSLKKVILPPGLLRILDGAFKGCRRLQEVRIPEGVSHIGSYAFHRCHELREISLPASVRELGDCAFLYCDSLGCARIPGVERLGKQVFVNDVLLKELELSVKLREDDICDVFTGCIRITDFSFSDGSFFVIPNAVEALAGGMEIPSLVRAVAVDILRMMELDGRCLAKFQTNLKHAEIPEGVEKIGKSSFFDKRGIISVRLPASLREIESRAFRNCISLERVSFQGDQIEIHENAFKNCSSLREVVMPDGISYKIEGISGFSETGGRQMPLLVRTIGKQILGNFRLSGSILLKYLGSESRVAVPDGVTSIAEEAFAGNEAIDRVILPESLREIGAGAFRGCVLLQTIEFPKYLKRIGAGAFENCVKLLRARLPEEMFLVEDKVFKHCHELREVVLGTCCTSVGEQAFYGCLSLEEISFPHCLAFIGEMAFYRCRGLKEVHLIPELARVERLAFAQSGVKRVRMSGGGEWYGTDLFSGCLRLRTVVLEEGVCHIPDKFAYGCRALRQVTVPESLRSVGRNVWEDTPFLESGEAGKVSDEIFWDGRNLRGEVHLPPRTRIVAGGAFYGNRDITEVCFPDSVEWIGPAALKGCASLRRVEWPAGLTVAEEEVFSGCNELERVERRDTSGSDIVPWQMIKERAFCNCRKLKDISLGETQFIGREAFLGCIRFAAGEAKMLFQVGERAFEDTAGLTEKGPFAVVGSILVSGGNCGGEVRLPEGLTAVAPFAFARNSGITKVILPEGLCSIGKGAFWGCGKLEEICASSSLVIGERAFEKCISLHKVSVHTAKAGKAAFAFCLSLEEVELRGLEDLEQRLFEGCSRLERCVCEQAQFIDPHCFSGCGSLKAFDLRRVKEVGRYAFQDCDALERIVLGEGAILRPHAFEDCGRLESIDIAGDMGSVRLYEYAFSGCTAVRRVARLGKSWNLRVYRDILSEEIPEAVRLIFQSALSCFEVEKEEILCGYRGLGRIVRIPEGIRRIEAEVFRDILMLEEITIPETVEYIGARAFHGTAWMEKQRVFSPMVTIGDMLLDGSGCVGEAVIPENIRLICGWAFAGGTGIESIRFLSDQVKAEAYAFRNCIYLRKLFFADGSSVTFQGISDRERDFPAAFSALAKQAAADSLNCFKTDEKDVLVECTGNISELLVAEGIKAIGDNVFQDGNLLTEITLPLSVTSIGKNAFAGCRWLKAVRQAHRVESVGVRAFSGCGTLERVEFGEKLRDIGARAFENCTALREVFLPEGIAEIPDRAFFRCHSLRKIYLPSTLKRIGKEAFAFCRSLQKPDIPEGVLVEERAFAGIGERE